MSMIISDILEVSTIAVTGFFVKKYVLLEPDLEGKGQKRFYLVSAFIVSLMFLILGKDIATLSALILVGINSCMAADKHRFKEIIGKLPVLVLSLLGIINGTLMLLIIVPPYWFGLSEQEGLVYRYIVYGMIVLLMIFFFTKCGHWRLQFQKTMKNRKLLVWEKCMLCVIGISMMIFSNATKRQLSMVKTGTSIDIQFMGIGSITAFLMTFISILLIMQGNKRNFYHEQVSDMQFNMITIMADIVENRDDNTGGHIKRTAKYVELIAYRLKKQGAYPDILTDSYVKDMIVAAPLHDIGKIHIPDSILNKPGRLTEDEFEIMKTHTTAGRDLLIHAEEELGKSDYLNMAIEMAANHHEWWDGNGYPQGVKGEEIPLCARIMAVADVFDALTSKRCYKSAMPLEKAYAIIREESGTHFDPIVAEAFLELAERGGFQKEKSSE